MNNDLISRDALKREACIKFYTTPYYKHILDLIDHAPTVKYPFDKFRTMLCGTCQAHMRIEPERPQGEWIAYQMDRWIYAKCPECAYINEVKTNFCPNCGIPMEVKSEQH